MTVDIFDIFDDLTPSRIEGYTNFDRFRDFRAVFLTSDQGKRVLNEILMWTGLFAKTISSNPVDSYASHIRMGERNIGVKLIETLNLEPVQKPDRVITEEE